MTDFFLRQGMLYDWAWTLSTVIGILVIALPLMLAVAMVIYAERKIWDAFAPGEAREDWTIFRAVSDLIGSPLPFDRFDQLRAAMVADYPQLGRDGLIDLNWAPPSLPAKASGPVAYPIADFYLTNAICRASPTMHRCSEELVHGAAMLEAAE